MFKAGFTETESIWALPEALVFIPFQNNLLLPLPAFLREMTHSFLWRYDYCEERLKNLLFMLENCLTVPPCPNFFFKTFNLFEEFSPFIRCDLINKVRDLRMYLETPVAGNVIQAPGGVFIC